MEIYKFLQTDKWQVQVKVSLIFGNWLRDANKLFQNFQLLHCSLWNFRRLPLWIGIRCLEVPLTNSLSKLKTDNLKLKEMGFLVLFLFDLVGLKMIKNISFFIHWNKHLLYFFHFCHRFYHLLYLLIYISLMIKGVKDIYFKIYLIFNAFNYCLIYIWLAIILKIIQIIWVSLFSVTNYFL